MVQLTPPPRFPGEGQDPLLPWAPAFAGEAGLNEVLNGLVDRVNESEHQDGFFYSPIPQRRGGARPPFSALFHAPIRLQVELQPVGGFRC
jgi:hypothetical protein